MDEFHAFQILSAETGEPATFGEIAEAVAGIDLTALDAFQRLAVMEAVGVMAGLGDEAEATLKLAAAVQHLLRTSPELTPALSIEQLA